MKKLLLAATLFIASDAAFAHSSVLSADNKGPAPAFGAYWHVVIVEPSIPVPDKASNSHRAHKPVKNEDPVIAFLFRLYLSFAR